MRDQATSLRNLALQATATGGPDRSPGPRLVVFAGGKGGVGVTTLALNTAVALAQVAVRVVFVDASLQGSDVSMLCGLEERSGTADVLASRRELQEVLQAGPCGLHVASGAWNPDIATDCSEMAQRRLIAQLGSLGELADLAIIDVGSGSGSMMECFWQAATEIVLTTTQDPVSVMDSYSTIKSMVSHGKSPPINVVVNRVHDAETADEVYRRIDQSCRRFLQRQVKSLGHVPHDLQVAAAAEAAVPAVIYDASCQASRGFTRVGATLATRLQKRSIRLRPTA